MSEEINENEHIGLIYRVAQELANTEEVCIHAFGKDISEYLGEGFLALQTAKKNFKPELGWKFSTYATEVIKDRLLQAAKRSTLIKISHHARHQACRVMQGGESEECNEKRTKDALRIMRSAILPISDFNDREVVDKNPLWELSEELYARLNKLDERTKNVIIMRYGLDGNDPLTLEEIGNILTPSITRERVRQIEQSGLNKLREMLNIIHYE